MAKVTLDWSLCEAEHLLIKNISALRLSGTGVLIIKGTIQRSDVFQILGKRRVSIQAKLLNDDGSVKYCKNSEPQILSGEQTTFEIVIRGNPSDVDAANEIRLCPFVEAE